MLRLEVLSGECIGRVLESDSDQILVGRGEQCGLCVTDRDVSAQHLAVVFNGQHWVARDLQSTNGTWVKTPADTIHLTTEAPDVVLDSGHEILLGAERPVVLGVSIREIDDGARIVKVREVGEAVLRELSESTGRLAAELKQSGGAVSEFLPRAELLRKLSQANHRIAAASEVESVFSAISEAVFEFLPRATHATLALRESDENGVSQTSSRYIAIGSRARSGAAVTETIPITQSVVKKVVRERSAVLAADARRDVGETASMMAAQILSTIGVPLWKGDDLFGVLQVDNRAAKGMFGESDLDFLALLAQSASLAIANAMLVHRLKRSEEKQRTENTYLKTREKRRFEGIIGDSHAMKALLDQLRKVVDTRVTVLIEGETGTGKELVSSAVHYWSNRRDKLFVAQNCAALPENLLESELFGHKKGAFTGATDDKKGLFEIAHEGTLFLDEVGEMPLSLQAKLLRVLQEGEVRPVGSNVTRKVDVRIVAATNRDLEAEVRAGRFREDLFYRLRVFPLRIPSLRERRSDIPELAGHFLERYATEFGRQVRGFSQQSMEQLCAYSWPGNVRELENEVQRLVIQCDDGNYVETFHLSPRIKQETGTASAKSVAVKGTLREMMDHLERDVLRDALLAHDNNKSATAKTLGITREGLHKKLKGFGIG